MGWVFETIFRWLGGDATMMAYAKFFGICAAGLLLYCMFVTRRTVLRALGWTIFLLTILPLLMMLNDGGATSSAQATRIIDDLRNLKSAAIMFQQDQGRWPLPGTGDTIGRRIAVSL
jgi:hypothetical protein